MTKLFIVVGNQREPGYETIYGVYPTRDLAVKRIKALEVEIADEDSDMYSPHADYGFGYEELEVGAEGGDCDITLR